MYLMQRGASELGLREPLRRCFTNVELYLTRAENSQESNEVSGSKGEANFVWRCKSCKVCTSFDSH